MASKMYDKGARKLFGGAANAIDWVNDTGIKVMLLTTTTPYTLDQNHEFVSSVVASEAAGTGYTGGFGGAGRKSIGTRVINDDLTNHKVNFGAANPSAWTSLSLTSGSISQVVVFKEITSDAASPIIAFLDPVDLVTNGGDVTLSFPSGVVFSIQN